MISSLVFSSVIAIAASPQTAPAPAWFSCVLTKSDIPGWHVGEGEPGSWEVVDSMLHCKGGEGGWIATQRSYTNFILELEYKLPPNGNSGVFIRIPPSVHPAIGGMEVQILDDYAEIHRHIKPGQHSGSLYMIAPATTQVTKPAGEWNHMWLKADGSEITVIVNDTTVVSANGKTHPEILTRSASGPLGLQDHKTELWFRNIKLTDLDAMRAQGGTWWRDTPARSVDASVKLAVRSYVDTVLRGGRMLLPLGSTQTDSSSLAGVRPAVLESLASWLSEYSRFVEAGEPTPQVTVSPDGRAWAHGNQLRLAVYDWPKDQPLIVSGLVSNAQSVTLMGSKPTQLECAEKAGELEINRPGTLPQLPAWILIAQFEQGSTFLPEKNP